MVARTSSRQIAAREQARERAATYAARERDLMQLAEEFFLADGEAHDVLEAAEDRIAAVREQAERDVAATRLKAASVTERMLATGAPAAQVADRLGLTVAELRRMRSTAAKNGGDTQAVRDAAADDAVSAAAESSDERPQVAPSTPAGAESRAGAIDMTISTEKGAGGIRLG